MPRQQHFCFSECQLIDLLQVSGSKSSTELGFQSAQKFVAHESCVATSAVIRNH